MIFKCLKYWELLNDSRLALYFSIESPFSVTHPDIIFRVERTSRKEKRERKNFRLLEKNSEKFMYTVDSQSTRVTLSLYDKRARDPPLERVPHGAKPRIPDINVKFAFRLSTPFLLSAHSLPLSPFITEGETVSFAIPLYLLVLFLSSLPSSLPCPLYFQISSCLSTTLSCLPPAASKFQLLSISVEHTYIHFHRSKIPPAWSFSPSCCCLPLTSLPSFFRVLPISHQCETTNEVQEE